ncbi:DUF5695 domain-containing protein [Granulicella sp. S156]|uniref:DUF5695 domain-containing protein n=1 Tax=Granulicella sp. S156 TaxID=1747224 RepID=UPI00131EB7FD|nr:DUF5695 domain-containing protein [Granulicella sp. S156]
MQLTKAASWLTCAMLLVLAGGQGFGQSYPAGRASTLGAMLDQGLEQYETPDLTLRLVRSSGTVAGLEPRNGDGFDFTPAELLAARSTDGYYHLGDLDLRLREVGTSEWHGYSTALERHPVKVLPLGPSAQKSGVLERDDLRPTLPAEFPLKATRSWSVVDGHIVLRFTLRNSGKRGIEIGALGIPLIFDNVMNGKNLDEAHAVCSFSDPSIAMDGGYVQVTRLNGHGPALLVVPDGKTPFEAYNPIAGTHGRMRKAALFEDLTPRSMTFEGFYEWMVASAAYQQNEWKQAEPWNPATSIVLDPGQERTVGVRFLVADSIRDIEKTLADNGRPVAIGFPGYILPQDIEASLFLKYPKRVEKVTVEPAGAIDVKADGTTEHGWQRYALRGKQWGRARLTVTYADGAVETVQYRVMKPEAEAVDDMGRFLFTKQWFDVKDDPFHRSPSVMSYDREVNAIVAQDSRVWIAGLGDEAGSGSWLAAAMKEYGRPEKHQIAQLENFVDGVLWGGLQQKDGPGKYGVRKSLFFYQPDQLPAGYYRKDLDWSSWESWNKEASEDLGRSYNYPHVVAAYWALYRLAREHQGLVTHHDWRWYLTQSYETTMAMTRLGQGLAQFGQMEGDVFVAVLDDLRREGMTTEAATLEAAMRARAEVWQKQAYPFGSEMPWDSTGQEEVYAWTRYFGMNDKAQVTLDAITGYMPTIPSWGYNGSARRYWDFLYGGKYPRIERQLHHYGSGINAIPVLDAYRRDPSDLYLLRIGYGGTMGALSGIDQEGFASAAFHSYPDKMAFDPYTGDYGPNFFGHAWNTGTYVAKDVEFGWLVFGGNLSTKGNVVTVEPRDSFRQRVFLAPLGLWLTLDSGQFERVTFNEATDSVEVELAPGDAYTSIAFLRIEQTAHPNGVSNIAPLEKLAVERGAYVVSLGVASTTVRLGAGVSAGK